jgi:aldehyde dehydrogenase (NAD+)
MKNDLDHAESQMLVGGELRAARSGATYDNEDPATESIIGVTADAAGDDMEDAIVAARRAFDGSDWSRDGKLRGHAIRQLAAGLEQVAGDFRGTFVRETGAPIALTSALIDVAIGALQFWAEMAESFPYEQDLAPLDVDGVVHRRQVWREAYGVVGVITPWNSPFQLNLMKLGPVLAAGNTVVLKPAPDTPWSGTIIGRVAAEHTDLPAGVLNVVTSSGNVIGDVLTAHPLVDGITFTGSTAVGRRVAARAADTVKKVALELGGKSANIVLDGADIETVARAAGGGVCWHAGQGCAVITRLVVPRSCLAEMTEAVAAVMQAIPNGGPFEPESIIGPLINRRQLNRVLGYIESGREQGATLVTGGRRAPGHSTGYFVEPTLFTNVKREMTINREEIFGPVLSILPYDSVDEAIDLANDTMYGLSAAVTGPSESEALDVARRLRSGTCAVNGGVWFGVDTPFGGYKQSGIGRENGTWGFEEFLETKVVALAM